MLGLPYERPAALTKDYLDVLDAAMDGPGPVDVVNERFTIHNPMHVTDEPRMSVLLAALGPVMLRLAGSRTDGTILWLADEKAIESHIGPRITAAATEAGRTGATHRRRCAGLSVPARARSTRPRPAPIACSARPPCRPTTSACSTRATRPGVSDILACGDEEMIRARLAAFESAGVTDISVRVLPIGDGRDELLESSRRTREFVADLAADR